MLAADLLKMVLAVILGGALGAEREYRDRAAGFRTIILICLGATLFTMFSVKMGSPQDPVRIAASIVSGIGFLGAGAILRTPGRVVGLTTAATIWLAAAVGVGVGGGYFALSAAATGITMVVLLLFPRMEEWIEGQRQIRSYRVTVPADSDFLPDMNRLIRECGLSARQGGQTRVGSQATCSWEVWGPPAGHARLTKLLLAEPSILELEA